MACQDPRNGSFVARCRPAPQSPPSLNSKRPERSSSARRGGGSARPRHCVPARGSSGSRPCDEGCCASAVPTPTSTGPERWRSDSRPHPRRPRRRSRHRPQRSRSARRRDGGVAPPSDDPASRCDVDTDRRRPRNRHPVHTRRTDRCRNCGRRGSRSRHLDMAVERRDHPRRRTILRRPIRHRAHDRTGSAHHGSWSYRLGVGYTGVE